MPSTHLWAPHSIDRQWKCSHQQVLVAVIVAPVAFLIMLITLCVCILKKKTRNKTIP